MKTIFHSPRALLPETDPGAKAFTGARVMGVLGGLLLAVGASLLVSCSSVSTHSTQYMGVPHASPTDPARVEILRAEPTRAHDRLGEVMVDATTDPPPPIAEVEQKLRAEAAKLGADAVVIVYDRIQPTAVYVTGPWWGPGVSTVTGRKLIAVAIKYR